MMKSPLLLCFCVFCATASVAMAAVDKPTPPPIVENTPPPKNPEAKLPADSKKSRGQLLYENHCTRCHESVVHIREQRKAASLNELYKWTIKWSAAEKLTWTGDETRDVVDYLNREYYKLQN